MRRFASYEEFWPFYLSQHLNRTCRGLHFFGTLGVIGCAIQGIAVSSWFFLLMPVAGYLFAWIGHFGFEHNRPATFEYPLWSMRGDFRMFRLTLLGKLDAELVRLGLSSSPR
jgi:hypothetical protein